MRTVRRLLAAFLAAALLCTLPFPTAFAVGNDTNLILELNKTEAEVGDTVTVTVKNRAMKVCSFTGGVSFDPEKVTCIGINPADARLTDTSGESVKATRTSTTETAAVMNAVGFGFASAYEDSYRAGTLLTVTFKVIGTGTTGLTLYEDSDGTDGFRSEAAETTVLYVKGEASYLPDGTNIAPLASADADSYGSRDEGPSYPSNMTDGDKNTRWQSQNEGSTSKPAWASLTWENEKLLNSAVIYWTSAHPVENGFKMQISEDGRTWTDTPITVKRANASNDRVTDTVTFTETPNTKYLRVYCFDNGQNGKYNPAITEFEVYGVAGTAPAKPLLPTASVITDHSITLTKVNGYEYSRDSKTWQKDPYFGSLLPQTDYIFYQRAAATASEEAGPASAGVTFTTGEGKGGLLGDTDLDGTVGAADLTKLARHVGGITALSDPTALLNADTDGDGSVGSTDLTRLARFVGGIISAL